MGKKQVAVSLRKPPPADPDAFVSGGADNQSSAASLHEHSADGPTIVTRVGERREITVYLPTALARELSVRCVEMDRDMSSLVAESLIKTLSIEQVTEAPLPALPPPPVPGMFERLSRARDLVSQFRARLPLGLGLA